MKKKLTYTPPEVEAIELKHGGMLCHSGNGEKMTPLTPWERSYFSETWNTY